MGSAPFLVVDLEDMSVSCLDKMPAGGWDEEHKTKKLVLRHIPAGTFLMGSPVEEEGRLDYEKLHEVTLTKPFYMGVFQVTQKQYETVTGSDPACFKGAARPVECVSYDMIRGKSAGAMWPANDLVDENSFLGVLRAGTKLGFDLPTEAQWEYACRAGAKTALCDGTNLTDTEVCPNLDRLGRYYGNLTDGKGDHHTVVGSYLPNEWGLYDMHGNVWEWCLDYCQDLRKGFGGPATDPKGSPRGVLRIFRGGSWVNYAEDCRCANRNLNFPDRACNYIGFRMVLNFC